MCWDFIMQKVITSHYVSRPLEKETPLSTKSSQFHQRIQLKSMGIKHSKVITSHFKNLYAISRE